MSHSGLDSNKILGSGMLKQLKDNTSTILISFQAATVSPGNVGGLFQGGFYLTEGLLLLVCGGYIRLLLDIGHKYTVGEEEYP